MPLRPAADSAVFTAPFDLDALELCYRDNGFVVLRGLLDESAVADVEAQCTSAQQQVVAGELDERYGSTVFLDDAAKAERFANYVEFVSELSPAVRDAARHPALVAVINRLLGERAWLRDATQFGVVYQDARPGRESGYSRIGWHSDWQSAPSLDIWPATAFTIHVDATSPANGYLRVVPGSHQWATPAPYRNANGAVVPDDAVPARGYTDVPPPFPMPLRFEGVAGEIPVFCERGDVLLHDGYLWHSAARATDEASTRRHVRGGFYGGDRSQEQIVQFVKNAAR
ncbi:phytanoyl-CoA dioxygenase family protein [Jatrophihabitans sp.]|uniref:phytanoyl-CoA dioxygenase family protein n=1 Tax=Jatrophihabitans sp. TaxID=1932789 RepID=UPI0030C66C75|nr:phytanoyl-CoA dioxygenase (PhyH) protein [Jatrophihabitans sp.]